MRQALTKIDDVSKATVHQMVEHSKQRLDALMRSAKEEVFRRMEARLAEDRRRWERQQEAHRKRAEELTEHLEHLASGNAAISDRGAKLLEETIQESNHGFAGG